MLLILCYALQQIGLIRQKRASPPSEGFSWDHRIESENLISLSIFSVAYWRKLIPCLPSFLHLNFIVSA